MSSEQRICPVCGATHSVPLARLNWRLFADHPLLVPSDPAAPEGTTVYGVDACSCGMSFASPIASPKAFESYYARWSRYASGTDSLSGPPDVVNIDRYRGTVDRVVHHLATSRVRILDVGCLEGGLLGAFQTLGYDSLAGVDPAPESMRRAAQKGIDVRVGTVDAIPFPDRTFDLVLCVHVLEHVADLSNLDLFRVLTHDGRLYVEVPDAASYNVDTPDIYSDLSLEHINHFDLPSLVGLLQRHGFRAVETGKRTYHQASNSPAMQDSIWGIFERNTAAPKAQTACPQDHSMLRCYLEKSKRRADEFNTRLVAFIDPGEAFRLWGTGHGAFRLLGLPALIAGRLCSATDTNPLYWGKRLAGTVVVPPDTFLAGGGKVVITSAIHGQNIAARLRENRWDGEIFVP